MKNLQIVEIFMDFHGENPWKFGFIGSLKLIFTERDLLNSQYILWVIFYFLLLYIILLLISGSVGSEGFKIKNCQNIDKDSRQQSRPWWLSISFKRAGNPMQFLILFCIRVVETMLQLHFSLKKEKRKLAYLTGSELRRQKKLLKG